MNKIVIFFVLIFADIISKHFVKNNLIPNQSVEINDFLYLVYIQNFGVSFGLFAGSIPYYLLIIIGLLIVILIIYLMYLSKNTLEKSAYFIIIIGALSNILDRLFNTFVVDFISLRYESFYWPAFNLADIYITIGIIMLIISFLNNKKLTNE